MVEGEGYREENLTARTRLGGGILPVFAYAECELQEISGRKINLTSQSDFDLSDMSTIVSEGLASGCL